LGIQASRDGSGPSLRELELESRLLRHSCSYLIRSPAFAALPERVRRYVTRRMAEILDGTDESGDFGHIDAAERGSLTALL